MSLHTADTGTRRRFELKRRIGAGAFGEVFLAEQVGAGGFRRPVALKLLNESAARMKEAARRMRDEARILGRLQHRHLVDVLDLVQLGDRWAVVMAYVPGADLEQVLLMLEQTGGSFPATCAAEVGIAVAKALHAAWSAEDENGQRLEVVHRDIKPSNIRLTPDGEVKVLDFGVARVRMAEREAMTRKQGLMGTERYMAPERILMEGDGPAGDVYALAATVAELVLGEPIGRTPVREGKHEAFVANVAAMMRSRVEGSDEACEGFVALIVECLAGEPQARPSSRDFALRLDGILRGLEGPTLHAWSSEHVDRVPEALGTGSGEPVTGTLIEGSDLTSDGARTGETAAPGTFIAEDVGEERRGGVALLWPILGLAVALLAGSAALVLAASEGEVDPPAVVETPAASVAAEAVPDEAGRAEEVSSEAAAGSEEAEVAEPAPSAPAEEPEPEPEPVKKAAPKPSEPARSRAEPEAGTPEPEPEVAAPVAKGPRVSRAVVAVADVEGFTVSCGDRTARGTASTRITDFPAGACSVTAMRGGDKWTTSVEVDKPREVRCAVEGEALSCR